MNLLAVSDLHLNASSEERNDLFLEFLEQAYEDGDEVLLIGDLFDLWFGGESVTFSFQRPILARMRDLAAQGLVMDYVEGNRDFFIGRYCGSIFRSVSSREYHRTWGDCHVYVEHGDWINPEDKQYRRFRRISRNRFTRFLMMHLPSRFFLAQAEWLEQKMRNTNIKYKVRYPENHCRRFAEDRGREGADLVVVGHFHEEKMWEIPIQERTVLFYNLPGWENGFRYLVVPRSQRPYFKEKERKSHGDFAAS